jgi:hypothetical protein
MVTFGALTPGVPGANVVVTYTRPDGTTFQRTVAAHPDGTWNDSITPSTEDPGGEDHGVWKIRSRYAGDASHAPSSKPDCAVLVVPRGTSIEQFCPTDDVGPGANLGVTGRISPGGDLANIVVRYTRPDGTFVEHTTQTDGNGGFGDIYSPDVGGNWKIQSRFDGDGNRGGSTTPACTVHVTR